jgi:hypothetical protein
MTTNYRSCPITETMHRSFLIQQTNKFALTMLGSSSGAGVLKFKLGGISKLNNEVVFYFVHFMQIFFPWQL